MKIAIGCDHGALALKNKLVTYLGEKGYEVKDFGTYSSDSCNYPDYAKLVGEAVAAGEFERGILVCGTGIGISIAANKIQGIRAACVSDTFSAKMCRLYLRWISVQYWLLPRRMTCPPRPPSPPSGPPNSTNFSRRKWALPPPPFPERQKIFT